MAALIAAILGFGVLLPKGIRMENILKASDNGKIRKEESVQVDGIISRVLSVEKINFVLVMVAILSMMIARII